MTDIATLIERQIALENRHDRSPGAMQTPGSCVVEGVAYGPCLLVSREYGSGGGVIAHRVGERLGWNFFDRELVNEIAEAANVRKRLVESVDEHVRTYWERMWRDVLRSENLADENYLRYLRQVVTSLGHHGRVVIVGRGAHCFLPPECAVRLRVVAPLEFRVKEVARRDGLSLDQARAAVQKFDTDRSSFMWKAFRQHGDSILSHDLAINTGEVNVEAATEIVLAALREKLGVWREH